MAINDLTQLLKALLASRSAAPLSAPVAMGEVADLVRPFSSELSRQFAGDAQALARTARVQLPAPASPRMSSGPPLADGPSPVSTILKTLGMASGVGPMVTGLMKIFGSGAPPESLTPPTPYQLPPRVSVEAGISRDRAFVPVSYSAAGTARSAESLTGSGSERAVTRPTHIEVNINALDSRSFMDHSDEIARAVRDAMLRSHSINDIVSEI